MIDNLGWVIVWLIEHADEVKVALFFVGAACILAAFGLVFWLLTR